MAIPTHEFDIIIVGSGLFGCTVAQVIAEYTQKRILLIEKREHLGGNSFSEYYEDSGIEVHKYGSHLFHTSNEEVWKYVNMFSKFNSYVHRVKTVHKDVFYSLPINLQTLSQFFGRTFTPKSASEFLNSQVPKNTDLSGGDFETRAILSVGKQLYEAFFRNYTEKQWQTNPKNLPGDVFARIPIRLNFDDRYFSDKYQGIPHDGYTKLCMNMLSSKQIKYMVDTDFFDIDLKINSRQLLVYTGPIDKYFGYKFDALTWRTLDFEWSLEKVGDFQGNSVVNYADSTPSYTRIHEFKHLHPERNHPKDTTVIAKEYSRFATKDDEPYYPVNSPLDREKLLSYRQLTKLEKQVFFGGRLGRYQYLDMHMAISSALKLSKALLTILKH